MREISKELKEAKKELFKVSSKSVIAHAIVVGITALSCMIPITYCVCTNAAFAKVANDMTTEDNYVEDEDEDKNEEEKNYILININEKIKLPYQIGEINFFSSENEINKINLLPKVTDDEKIIVDYLKKIYSLNFLYNHSLIRNYNNLKIEPRIIWDNYDYFSFKIPLIIKHIYKYGINTKNIMNAKHFEAYYNKNNNKNRIFQYNDYISSYIYLPFNNLVVILYKYYLRCDIECCGASYENRDENKKIVIYEFNSYNNENNKIVDNKIEKSEKKSSLFLGEVISELVCELKDKTFIYMPKLNIVSLIKFLYKNNNLSYEVFQNIEYKNYILDIIPGDDNFGLVEDQILHIYIINKEKSEKQFKIYNNLDKLKYEKILINKDKILFFKRNINLFDLKEYIFPSLKFENYKISGNLDFGYKLGNINSKFIYIFNLRNIYFLNLNTHQIISKINIENHLSYFYPLFYHELFVFRNNNKINIFKFNKNNYNLKLIREINLELFSEYTNYYIFINNNKIFFAGTISYFVEFYSDFSYMLEMTIFEYINKLQK